MYRLFVDLLARKFVPHPVASMPAAGCQPRSGNVPAALSFCLVAVVALLPVARAQSVYFDPSTLSGTIGSNHFVGTLNECPNNEVLVGVQVQDRANVAPNATWGILVNFNLRCGTISVSPAGTVVVTPDAAYTAFPTIFGQGDGTLHTANCPAGQVVTQLGGDTFNTTGSPWASTIRIYCRPLTLTASGQIRVNTGVAATQLTAGDDENNTGSGFAGPFCGTANTQIVR
ncbi:MAG TPA: hypothetical protein VJ696_03700, partial [Rhodanobacteraceae bacterium]|nr:hypothetical protein [Rhodanobacteraceae bacterium]